MLACSRQSNFLLCVVGRKTSRPYTFFEQIVVEEADSSLQVES